eukprot:TRINITY_DN8760_c0_g1_i2.p1 TRINITY_DN8760_c0_g1~~TRINITY_DN8760_c0_g1_i2.p1  ORF type:complete len:180 (+),score=54.31 TRINITY_DN8760_c0_g1_i2:74-541(+)
MLRSLVGSEMCIRDRTHSAATGAVDGSGDSVNIASRAIRCRMPKTFHNVTAIWAQVYGVDALASISPDFTTINENLATIVAAYADSTTPSSAPSTLSTPEERCNDLTVAVVAAAACLLWRVAETVPCLLYTSDAADEEDSVDLGGRRIIKKKKRK